MASQESPGATSHGCNFIENQNTFLGHQSPRSCTSLGKSPKNAETFYSEFRLSSNLRSKSQARRFIAIKVGIVAEEEETF